MYIYRYLKIHIYIYIHMYTYFIIIIYIFYTYYNSTLLAHSGNKLPIWYGYGFIPFLVDLQPKSRDLKSRHPPNQKWSFYGGKSGCLHHFHHFPMMKQHRMNHGFLMFSVYCMVHHVQLHPLAAKAPCRCHPADQSEWPVGSSRRTWGVSRCC